MPLARKLFLALLIPALLIGATGAVGVTSLLHLRQAAGRILAQNYRSIQEVRRMERALRRLERLTAEPGCASDGERRAALGLVRDFSEALALCEGNLTEEGEHVILARIRGAWEALLPALRVRLAASTPAACVGTVDGTAVHTAIDELITLNERAMFADEGETRRVGRLMVASVSGVLAATLLALFLFALVSARRIARPVTQVADRLHAALNPPPDGSAAPPTRPRGDEIERLRAELEALLNRLARYEDEQNRRLVHVQGRLAFVINEVLEGLVLLDDTFRILAANRVGAAVLGVDPGEQRRIDAAGARPEVIALLAPLLDGTFRAERDLGEVTHESDGQPRIYRPRVLPILGGGAPRDAATGVDAAADDLRPEGYLLLFWDVTEQRQFEESRRRFISMLSHELKTPMTSLRMSVDLLRERLSAGDGEEHELLDIAADNCRSLSRLVSDLIDAARDATPDLSLRPRRIDLVRLVRYALRPLQPQAQEKGIVLSTPREEARVFAAVDPVKFPWIVSNIAGNAVRYTSRGGRIDVAVDTDDEAVEIRIADTGAGIDPEHLGQIFEPYVSADAEPRAGTHGLGLAIAREIVEAHGGTITAESALGVGTTFRIRLPREEVGR